jgi:hypothetical protein
MVGILRRGAAVSLALFTLLLLQPVNTPVAYADDCCCECDCCCTCDEPDPGGGGHCRRGSRQVTLHVLRPGEWAPPVTQNTADEAFFKTLNSLLQSGYVVYVENRDYPALDGVTQFEMMQDPSTAPDTKSLCMSPPPGFCDEPMWSACIEPGNMILSTTAAGINQWKYKEQSEHCHGQFTRYKWVNDVGNDGSPKNDPAVLEFECTDYDGYER